MGTCNNLEITKIITLTSEDMYFYINLCVPFTLPDYYYNHRMNFSKSTIEMSISKLKPNLKYKCNCYETRPEHL